VRSRLTLTLVVFVAAALLLTGAGALLVARSDTRDQSVRQLQREGRVLASASSHVRSRAALEVARTILHLERGSLVMISPTGTLVGRQPKPALRRQDIARLLDGLAVSGVRHNVAFAAVPVHLVAPSLTRLQDAGGVAAVLLTEPVGTLAPGWLYLLLASGVVLVAAAAVAAVFSRRITRPLVEASTATGRIADGELGTRLADDSPFPELASLAASINLMASRLEAARTHESQLLLSVSHDLRTPLTSIRGYAEAVREGVVDAGEGASVIVSESRRLERLVGDLLELAKLESDHLSLRLGEVDLAIAAREATEAFGPEATAEAVTLSVIAPPPGTRAIAWADPDRVGQILANLLQNAIRYAASRVVVAVSPEADKPTSAQVPGRTNRSWSVTVTDDGPGIAPHELSLVFDRFYQGDRGDAARTGSGLGLAIVAELARAMAGSVHAESPAIGPVGTRMVLELPSADGGA
jgi:signal transduction histidine kinase